MKAYCILLILILPFYSMGEIEVDIWNPNTQRIYIQELFPYSKENPSYQRCLDGCTASFLVRMKNSEIKRIKIKDFEEYEEGKKSDSWTKIFITDQDEDLNIKEIEPDTTIANELKFLVNKWLKENPIDGYSNSHPLIRILNHLETNKSVELTSEAPLPM